MDALQYVRDLIAAARRQDGFCLGVLVPWKIYRALGRSALGRVDLFVDGHFGLDGVRLGPILDD